MSRAFRMTALVAVAATLLAVPATVLRAQDAQAVSGDRAPLAPSRVEAPAPRTVVNAAEAPAPVAAHRALATDARATRGEAARRAGAAAAGRAGQGKVYMIVGGAAFVAGMLIGDDIGTLFMVGGAGVGLYGLYLYVQ